MAVVNINAEMRRAYPEDAAGESACRFVEVLVCAALDVELGELRSPERGRRHVAFARQAAMYLAHVGLGLSLSRVGEHFRRDRTTVAHACARVEDRRDDAAADRVLRYLEAAVRLWLRSARPLGAAP